MSNKPKVLMVDDDASLGQVARCVFEAEGFDFAWAGSAAEGLAAADRARPDVIVLDVMMEDVFAGLRLLSTLRGRQADPQRRRRYGNVPVVLFTSVQQKTNLRFTPQSGSLLRDTDALVEKPVQPKTLLSAVRSVLELAGGRESEPSDVTAPDAR